MTKNDKGSTWIRKTIWIVAIALSAMTLCVISGLIYIKFVDLEITEKFDQLKSSRSSRFLAPYPDLSVGEKYEKSFIDSLFQDAGLSELNSVTHNRRNTFEWKRLGADFTLMVNQEPFSLHGEPAKPSTVELTFSSDGTENLTIESIRDLSSDTEISSLQLRPKRLGYYFAGRLRTQHSVSLSQIPVSLRLAVMGIEDARFLEHHGVSIRSTVRALVKDLVALKWVQGGSTLTQQLMKNLFFSHEKVLSRKLKEALYAFVTESRHSKEDILEAYLNEVYLGRIATHEIHGVAEASQYYFNKSVAQLNLSESAMLAGMIQRPNYFSPHRNPKDTLTRRNTVLNRMRDAQFVLDDEFERAINTPLSVSTQNKDLEEAGYFMDLVFRAIADKYQDRMDKDALTIETTLNPFLQAHAARSLNNHLTQMENYYKTLKDKKEKGLDLQGALVSFDLKNCSVLALQGGKSFKQTQFNRVLQGKRQPGSLFKPFVVLTGIDQKEIHALTEIDDSPFEWAYDKQNWIPRNYDEEFRGPVTVRKLLVDSLNVPTAKLAQQIEIPNIVSTLTAMGVQSILPKLPSVSLGSAEVTPFELAETYATLANLGNRCSYRSYTMIYDEHGNVIEENKPSPYLAFSPISSFLTVDLLKGVLDSGTAKLAKQQGMNVSNLAGKTGTTNDYKDAWFVGFSPNILTLVWVGYDSTEAVGLSGAAAALPVWIQYMKSAKPWVGTEDFTPPDGVVQLDVDLSTKTIAKENCPEKSSEYFRTDDQPSNRCPIH